MERGGKVSKRLDKGGLFLLGGRVTLVQACLSSISIYYTSLFKVLVSVLKCLEGAMRNFLSTGNGKDMKDDLVN